jgi:hypothetical protein
MIKKTTLTYLKLAGQLTGILSILLTAISVLLTYHAVRTTYRIDAHKTSQQLLLNWYDLKARLKQGQGDSIREPMQTELTAFKTLFLAESIFLMMKESDQKSRWVETIDYLIKDATGLNMNDSVIDETFDPEFAERVKRIFKDGKNNKGELMPKFGAVPETARP